MQIYQDICKFIPEYYSQTISSSEWKQPRLGNVLVASADKQSCKYDAECPIQYLSQSPYKTGIEQ